MEAIDYARELVSFESTSTLSNTPVTDYLEETLEGLGFETERVEYTDRREWGNPTSWQGRVRERVDSPISAIPTWCRRRSGFQIRMVHLNRA